MGLEGAGLAYTEGPCPVSSVAGENNFQVHTEKKEIHMDSESILCVAPVQVQVAGLYSNALVLLCGLLFF